MTILHKWIIFFSSIHVLHSVDIPSSVDYMPGEICSNTKNGQVCESCNLLIGGIDQKCCENSSIFKKCLLAVEISMLFGRSGSTDGADPMMDENLPDSMRSGRMENVERNIDHASIDHYIDYDNSYEPSDPWNLDDRQESLRDKRRGVFLGKRRKIFLGKKDLRAERVGPRKSGKRRNPFLGKRDVAVEKRKNPFLGKRGLIKSGDK